MATGDVVGEVSRYCGALCRGTNDAMRFGVFKRRLLCPDREKVWGLVFVKFLYVICLGSGQGIGERCLVAKSDIKDSNTTHL